MIRIWIKKSWINKIRALILAIRFLAQFRVSFFDNGLGQYVRVWFGGTTHLDIEPVQNGAWLFILRNDSDGRLARHRTDYKESWL